MAAHVPVHVDEQAVAALFAAFAAGWNAQDGAACAAPFARDADFTAITGLRACGRERIARGHDEIFATVYRGTRLTAELLAVRFLRDDVALAEAQLHVKHGDGRPFDFGPSLASVTAVKDGGTWTIAAFRNMIPFQRPPAGALERELVAKAARGGRPSA